MLFFYTTSKTDWIWTYFYGLFPTNRPVLCAVAPVLRVPLFRTDGVLRRLECAPKAWRCGEGTNSPTESVARRRAGHPVSVRRYALVCGTEPKWHGRAYGPDTVFIVIVIAACRNPRKLCADTNQTQTTATFISASLPGDEEFNSLRQCRLLAVVVARQS